MGLFNGKANQVARSAKSADRSAHKELHAYCEAVGLVDAEDPTYLRLNKKANQTHAAVKAAKKNARRR